MYLKRVETKLQIARSFSSSEVFPLISSSALARISGVTTTLACSKEPNQLATSSHEENEETSMSGGEAPWKSFSHCGILDSSSFLRLADVKVYTRRPPSSRIEGWGSELRNFTGALAGTSIWRISLTHIPARKYQ